jgi:hypothetical protein
MTYLDGERNLSNSSRSVTCEGEKDSVTGGQAEPDAVSGAKYGR